jgi:hypothetical protein
MASNYSVVMIDFTNDDPTDMVVRAALQTTVFSTSLPDEASMMAERTCQDLVERLAETDGVAARWEFVVDSYLVWMKKAGDAEEVVAYRVEIDEADADEVEIVDTDVSIDDLL